MDLNDGEQSKKINVDLIHNVHEAQCLSDLSDELNVCECLCEQTGMQLLIAATKAVYYHEPSHLKLVVTSSSSYYIQADYLSYYQM